jgi:hypothetical protein
MRVSSTVIQAMGSQRHQVGVDKAQLDGTVDSPPTRLSLRTLRVTNLVPTRNDLQVGR